jgi:hypothetical protein
MIAVFLALTPAVARAADQGTDISCMDPSGEDAKEEQYADYKFDDKRHVFVYSEEFRLVFCRADEHVSKHVRLPAVALGQATVLAKEGLAGFAYRGRGKRGPRLAIFRSSGELIADLKMSELNATFWVENGKINAGGSKDGITVLDFSGKVIERRRLPNSR